MYTKSVLLIKWISLARMKNQDFKLWSNLRVEDFTKEFRIRS